MDAHLFEYREINIKKYFWVSSPSIFRMTICFSSQIKLISYQGKSDSKVSSSDFGALGTIRLFYKYSFSKKSYNISDVLTKILTL